VESDKDNESENAKQNANDVDTVFVRVSSAIVLVLFQLISLAITTIHRGFIDLLGVFGACPDCAKSVNESLAWIPNIIFLFAIVSWVFWVGGKNGIAILVSILGLVFSIGLQVF
jgi:hypothetical protein